MAKKKKKKQKTGCFPYSGNLTPGRRSTRQQKGCCRKETRTACGRWQKKTGWKKR